MNKNLYKLVAAVFALIGVMTTGCGVSRNSAFLIVLGFLILWFGKAIGEWGKIGLDKMLI